MWSGGVVTDNRSTCGAVGNGEGLTGKVGKKKGEEGKR